MRDSLSDFKLYYEDLERKTVKTAPSKAKVSKATKATPVKGKSLKEKLSDRLQPVRSKIDNIVRKVKQPRKKAKKTTKAERLEIRKQKIRGIIGIGLLLTVVSIVYSTYMVNLFVDGTEMIVALAPQVIFATLISIYAFYKIYK